MLRPRTVRRGWILGALFLGLASRSPALLAQDCNLNGANDAGDIKAGVSEDCNGNGIPDVCEIVPLAFGTIGDRPDVGGDPQVVTSADLDGDGLRDVALGTWLDRRGSEARLSIFFNRGAGTFAPELAFETTELSAVEIADVDSDGDLDLVTQRGGGLDVYPNDGMGGFAETCSTIREGIA